MRHLSVDDSIRQALEESARAAGIAADLPGERDCSAEAVAARRASINRLVAEIAALPVRDPRSPKKLPTTLTLYDCRRYHLELHREKVFSLARGLAASHRQADLKKCKSYIS